MQHEISWVTCDGGPHLVLPSELVSLWAGASEPAGGRKVSATFRWNGELDSPATDYDAACDVEDLLGTVALGEGHGLVLGDEVPMSTWLPNGPFGCGVFVVPMEWPDAEALDSDLVAVIRSLPEKHYVETSFEISTIDGGFKLIAANNRHPWPPIASRCEPCRLTPPSSGHPPASCACFRPPLMSNVRCHMLGQHPPSIAFVVVSFLVGGPLVMAFAAAVVHMLAAHSAMSPELVFSPVLAVFGAVTWWMLALNPDSWPYTLLPTIISAVLFWAVLQLRHRYQPASRYERGTRLVICIVAAGIISSVVFVALQSIFPSPHLQSRASDALPALRKAAGPRAGGFSIVLLVAVIGACLGAWTSHFYKDDT